MQFLPPTTEIMIQRQIFILTIKIFFFTSLSRITPHPQRSHVLSVFRGRCHQNSNTRCIILRFVRVFFFVKDTKGGSECGSTMFCTGFMVEKRDTLTCVICHNDGCLPVVKCILKRYFNAVLVECAAVKWIQREEFLKRHFGKLWPNWLRKPFAIPILSESYMKLKLMMHHNDQSELNYINATSVEALFVRFLRREKKH